MRQTLSEYDERDDGFELVGEERPEEEYGHSERRLPSILLAVLAMAVFAGGLWFAYYEGTRHAAVTAAGAVAPGDSVPLIRADQRPDKVKPAQPGGMSIPDQNASIYNEKPGVPAVERLLPTAEQPMPRPAAIAVPAAAGPSPAAAPVQAAPVQAAPAGSTATARPAPAAPAASAPSAAAAESKPAPPRAAAASPRAAARSDAGPLRVRLASLRTPEAAREEWARLKHDYPDLLGKLTAVAVRTDLGDQGIYYRIEAGPLADAAAAERLCGELKRRNRGCILAR